MLRVKSDTFESEVLKDSGRVLVDFSAVWCGPCARLAPILEEISEQYSDKVKFCKVDIDESRDLAMRYGIMSVPTLMLFQNGAPVDSAVGLMPKEKVLEFLHL